MKKTMLPLLLVLLLAAILITGCSKKSNDLPQYLAKIGLIGSVGGFNDHGFNQAALQGLQAGTLVFPFYAQARNSSDTGAYRTNMNYFLQNNYDLIISLGFEMKDLTIQSARQNPMLDFALLDVEQDSLPSNLRCVAYQVDQASFLCGFLAAYWAQFKDPSQPVAGYVAGPDIPEIRQFEVSYLKGVAYFNTYYGKSVQTAGLNADSFNDSLQGAQLAGNLISEGADVIFAFAGKTGNGALYKVLQEGKWGIGVDVDQFVSIPEVGNILLSSCMKRLDLSVYDLMFNLYHDNFQGGQVFYGNLSNNMVDLAPFHQFDSQIPDSIKDELDIIKIGIQNGTIPTGWPEK